MIRGTFSDYLNYFKQFSINDTDLKFFFFGGVEKGMDYARSAEGFDTPFMWLEQPIIVPSDNDASNVNLVFSTGVSVLKNAPLDDNEAQEQAYHDTLEILKKLLKKMRIDNREKTIFFSLNTAKIEAVSQLWSDSAYGWRLELNVELNINPDLY